VADYGATERVRRFVVQHFFEPARRRGERKVTIHAGSLSKLLEEKNLLQPNRYPLICGAMTNSGFASKHGARLEERRGPQSGLSSSATFTFVLESPAPTEPLVPTQAEGDGEVSNSAPVRPAVSKFMALRGILKEAYAEVGGAKAFHEAERDAWER
jgi:hypothetical protein